MGSNYQLMKHQAEAIKTCAGRECFAYFMEPGLGKTLTVIHEVQQLPVETIVVICPKSIMSVWYEEIEKFAPTNGIDMWGGGYKTGSGKYWTIINIDAVNRVKGSKNTGFELISQLLRGFRKTMVVVDESTTIKNPNSKRTKAVTELGQLAKYRRILTGTPVANTPLDIYSQMVFLNKDIFPYSKNFFAFRARYAVMGGYENRQVVGYKNLEHLAEIVTKHSFQATKAQCLDLPERTTQIRSVELSTNTWGIYRTLVDELVVELGNTEMPIDVAVTKITKLRQLTGGWIKDAEGNVHRVATEKFKELEALLDECQGQKIIIWTDFVHEILSLQKLHPKALVYYGAMNTGQRDEARHLFEDLNSGHDIIVIQNATGSTGLTLNAATVSIFYSNPTYPLHKQQARERNHRIGQKKCITEYELIVKGSIDETIYVSILNRVSLAETLMAAHCGTKDKINALKNFLMPHKKVDWKSPRKGVNRIIKADMGPDLGQKPKHIK